MVHHGMDERGVWSTVSSEEKRRTMKCGDLKTLKLKKTTRKRRMSTLSLTETLSSPLCQRHSSSQTILTKAYNLSEKLSHILDESSLSRSEQDPRLDLLESSLSSLLSGVEKKDPECSRSCSIQGRRWRAITAQNLAILPDPSPSHVTQILQDDRFGGNVERVLEGRLDGSLGSEWDVHEGERPMKEKGGKGKQRAKSKDEDGHDAFGYESPSEGTYLAMKNWMLRE